MPERHVPDYTDTNMKELSGREPKFCAVDN